MSDPTEQPPEQTSSEPSEPLEDSTESPEQPEGVQHRLDPDRAAAAAARPAEEPPPPVVDTRKYRWMIGIFGLALVVAISIDQFATHGVGTAGVPPGKRLHYFVAPLATSSVNLDANANPRCDPAHPNPDGLNVCGRTPIVLDFFVTGSNSCVRQVDTLQAVSAQFPPSQVQFAAVAIRASHASTVAVARSHHWTIPVAYDRDGAIGALYGVAICPMVELARGGGIVTSRLIGNHWLDRSALAGQVRALVGK